MPFSGYSPFPNFFGSDPSAGSAPSYAAYGQAAMPDFRFRESAYAGNSQFVGPGGPRTGNPLYDLGAMAVSASLFPGKELRPFSPVEGGDVDFLRNRGRFNDQFKHYREEIAMHGVLPASSQLGQSLVIQQAMEGFKYGGSTYSAFQTAYGRFGSTFGETPRMQGRRVTQLTEGIDDAFDSTDASGRKGYDYNKSFGFNRQESVENLDSAVRFGFHGYGRDELTRRTRRGEAGEMARDANEVTRLGKSTFGSDQSADQINGLLDKAMGGLAGVTTQKASEFLARVQSVSRALDVNAKAFTEYVAAQQETYKAMGIGGPIAAEMILNNAPNARSVSDRGRASGDAILGDQNRAAAALAANAASSQGSQFVRQLRFVGAQATRMTDEEDQQYGVDGQGLKANLAAINSMKAANNGAGAEALFSKVRARFGADVVAQGGRHLSEEDGARSLAVIPDVDGSDVDSDVRDRATKLAYERARGQRGFDENAVSLDTYRKAVSNLGALDMNDPAKVAAGLEAQGVDARSARANASTLSITADAAVSDTNQYLSLNRNTPDQVRASLDQTTPDAMAARQKMAQQVERDKNRALNLNSVMGSVTRPLNLPEAAATFISNGLEEMAKGGTFTPERAAKFAKQFGAEFVQTDDLTKVMSDYESGAMDVDPKKYVRPDLPGARGQIPATAVSPDKNVQAGLNRLSETDRLGEYTTAFHQAYDKEYSSSHDETKARAVGEKAANQVATKAAGEMDQANKELGETSKAQLEEQKKGTAALQELIKIVQGNPGIMGVLSRAAGNSELSK